MKKLFFTTLAFTSLLFFSCEISDTELDDSQDYYMEDNDESNYNYVDDYDDSYENYYDNNDDDNYEDDDDDQEYNSLESTDLSQTVIDAINNYLAVHHQNSTITEVEIENQQIEVELNDSTEIIFSLEGVFLRYDD